MGNRRVISEETRKWWVLGAVSCLLGLILLDETVVGVALPTIQKDFGLSTTGGHWVVNAYLLSFACLVAIGGKLADMFGILRVFLIGLAIFACSSILASVSPNGGILITARALQGIGAAICFPLFVAMTTITFPKEQRGTALGICGAVGTIFLAAGPFVGGLLTEIGSWRWIFAINPPFVLGIAVVSLLAWRDVPRPPRAAIDWLGLALLASSLFCLVFALMEADDWGWTSPTIVTLLILGLALLGAFIWAEVREDAPLIEVGLFLNKSFAASNLTMFIAQFAKMPIFVFVALYAQEALGLGPLGAGMLVMLSAILQPIVATVCGRMTDRMRPANLIYFGQVTLFVCLVWLCVTAPLKDPYIFAPGLLLAGIAFPFMFVPSQTAIMATLPEHKHGEGGGISISCQMIGGTVGLAVSSAVFLLDGYQLVFGTAALAVGVVFLYSLYCFRERPPSDRAAQHAPDDGHSALPGTTGEVAAGDRRAVRTPRRAAA